MNRKPALILAVAASLLMARPADAQFRAGYSDLGDSETVTSLKRHVATISSAMMEGRKAGSEGEKMTAEYLTEVLKEYGVDVISGASGDPFGIRQENGDTLTSRNVCAFIQGGDKTMRDRYIVIGARMDNLGSGTMTVDGRKVERIYFGANGNASGAAMLLELARMLQTNRVMLRRSVLLVGFGASKETFAGSWYFLNRSFSDVSNIEAMINLDMLGTGTDGFYAYTSSNADMNAMVESISGDLQPIRPSIVTQEPYPSDHVAFYDKGIPSIMFTTGRYAAHDTERDTQSIIDFDTMEKELEYIYSYSVALANGPKPIFNPSETVKLTGGISGAVPYYDCDVKPSFLGSDDPKVFLQKWVYSYMKYPQEAVNQGIQGRVLVDFIIDEEGKVRDVKVLKGADPLLDEEAVRIVSGSPKWKPGKVLGKKVRSEISLYIEFRLEKKGTKSFGIKK
ncbi:MAG: TonB family protein [Bacteroidales bacterium]|nr:TonB family protein [Bacteroidales bacterium]